jgi:TRAP-type mannitol/chloroaromatic compound transport system permease small subunit
MSLLSILTVITKSIDKINDKVGEYLSFFLFGFFILLLLEVFLRYVFNSPTVWANELSQMLFGAYAILTGGHIMRIGGHVNVDIVYSRLSTKKKAVLDIITSVLFFLFSGMLLVLGSEMAWDSLSRLEHSESAWNPPIYPIRLMIPLAAILLILQGIAKLIRDITLLFGIELEADSPTSTAEGESL